MSGSRLADELVENTRSHLLTRKQKAEIMEEAIRSSDSYGMHGMMTIIAFASARQLLTPSVVEALKDYFLRILKDDDLIDSYLSTMTKNLRVEEYTPLRELREWLIQVQNNSS